jgi:primosomal protein N' (replication factor Y) (superfamily II helicase)
VTGAVVRVPLGGRRVKGFVVEVDEAPDRPLKPLVGMSGEVPRFDQALLHTLLWAAQHYVAPVSVLLERTSPPNLPHISSPRSETTGFSPQRPPRDGGGNVGAGGQKGRHPLSAYAAAAATGRRMPTTVFVEGHRRTEWLEALFGPVIAAGRSGMIVAATGQEVQLIHEGACRSFPSEVISVLPDADAATTTRAWEKAATLPGTLLIGTPRVALWPVADLAVMVVVEEGRRAMKERQTPTLHVRDLLKKRAAIGRHNLVFVGPTPTLEVLSAGAETISSGVRAWPLVEVVDRNQDPGAGLFTERVRLALRATVSAQGSAFLFAHRRGYAPAHRCVACRTVRRCTTCGSRPEPGTNCLRCGAELGSCVQCGGERFEALGAGVGRVSEEVQRLLGEGGGEVLVGSEADLAGLIPRDLVVAVDADGLMLGTSYRASEEALRVLSRLAGAVRTGAGRRLMVQTSHPDHPVIVALRRGDPLGFATAELEQRRMFGFPPHSQLLVIELRGLGIADQADHSIRELGKAAVLGPARVPEGHRWLVQGADLLAFKAALRPLVQTWRDQGATVRIDSDPIDL